MELGGGSQHFNPQAGAKVAQFGVLGFVVHVLVCPLQPPISEDFGNEEWWWGGGCCLSTHRHI